MDSECTMQLAQVKFLKTTFLTFGTKVNFTTTKTSSDGYYHCCCCCCQCCCCENNCIQLTAKFQPNIIARKKLDVLHLKMRQKSLLISALILFLFFTFCEGDSSSATDQVNNSFTVMSSKYRYLNQ